MSAELHDTVATLLARAQQRYTARRRVLVELLAGAGRPVSIPDILAAGRGLAQSSVYRNLAVLEQAGVVHRIVNVDEFARYELAEDLTDHHHHHLICSSCGTVADFTASEQVERSMARAMAEVAESAGFTAAHHRLDLIGRCTACSGAT